MSLPHHQRVSPQARRSGSTPKRLSYDEANRRALESNRMQVENAVRELEAKPSLTPTEAFQLSGWRHLFASGKLGPSTLPARLERQTFDEQLQKLEGETVAIKAEIARRTAAKRPAPRPIRPAYQGPF
jgi:hypothetical protein